MSNAIFYNIKESFKNLWRNRMMTLASISSVTATLLILGIIFVMILNVNSLVDATQKQFDEIVIYIKDEVEIARIRDLNEDLKRIIGVKEVRYESKDDALEKWKDDWGENASLLDGLSENPLPNSFIIVISDLKYAENVVEILNNFSEVEEVKFYKDFVDSILAFSNLIKKIGLVLIVVLLGITTFIITNTIKIAVNSRRTEITIMKYVGASSWFIRWPFILEGVVIGFIGSLIGTGIIFALYRYAYDYFTGQFFIAFTSSFVRPENILKDVFVIFVVLGIGVGALGAINAIKKHLNV